MANKPIYGLDDEDGYQSTNTYKTFSPERRRQVNAYKKDCNISDEHMMLLMYKQDLEMVPEKERKQGNTTTYAMLVVGFLLLFNSLRVAMSDLNGPNVPLIFLSVGSFVLVAVVYYTGALNPYKRMVRNVNKRLKKMPEVPDFYEWAREHPTKADRKMAKRAKSRR